MDSNILPCLLASDDASEPLKRSGKSRARRRPAARRLTAELLEPRCLLSAETVSSLVYSGIAPSPLSPTNSGLLIATDVASGFVAPLHAPFSSTSDRANGWNLPPDMGFTGLAFGPGALDLLGTASSAGRSASNLLTMDPYTGVQRMAPVPVRAGNQAIHVSDLGVIPGAAYQLYGLGTSAAVPGTPFQLYVIDPGNGQAVALPDQPVWLGGLDEADALAFGPDGTIYVGGWESAGNVNVLYVQRPDGMVHRHPLKAYERIVGMDTRVTRDASEAVQVELLTSTSDGHWKWFDPVGGQFSSMAPELAAPLRGTAGDVVFHPDPESLSLQQRHHADFEAATDGYTANNLIHAMPGMWHPSTGRYQDSLINHTHGRILRPGYNWYYGQFETSTGGGTYLTSYRHGGILSSPPIDVPECATTTFSFSYLLDVRPPLDVDFVEVWAQYVDNTDQGQRHRLLSRAEGTLPETGNRWLTATADLSPYAGRQVQIQFLFDTGGIPDVDPEGWYVDDVVIASFPKAVCGYKWDDDDHDSQWDRDEPGLNGWTIYVDVNDNGQHDPATPEQTFAGGLDANAFASGRRVLHPDGQVVLEVSATGDTIWAMPDPHQPSQKVLARGTGPGEEVWPVGPMLRATFPTAAHTVSLDVAQASGTGSTRVVLQAYDQHENRIAEQERTLTGTSWQTITINTTAGEIAHVKASVDHGAARFHHLRYWGTVPAVEGDPTFVTRNNGQHDGTFWFDRLPPGEYAVREILPQGWKQSYPGPPDFAHTITVTAGEPVVGHWENTELPNFGNFKPDISGYKWYDLNYNGSWNKNEHEGLNGWRIELYQDTNGNGVLDAGEPLVDWTTTQWDGQHQGAYWFVDVAPGDYILREVLPDLWRQTYPGEPILSHSIRVIEGQPIVGRWQGTETPNFGNAEIAVIAGSKWEDANADGERNGDERGMAGWVILAYRDANRNGQLDLAEAMLGPAASAQTDTNGNYVLKVDPGDFVLVEMLRDDWLQSFPATPVLAPDLDRAVWRSGEYGYAVAVAGGQMYEGRDLGNYQAVDLTVTKTESVDPVIAGSGTGNLTYVVTVANLGPADASGVVISEVLTLPDGVTIDDITVSRGTLAGAAPDFTWGLGDLRVGEQEHLTVTLTVGADAADGADISNTATVTQVDQPDSNPDNNTVREDTTVRRLADLQVTKSESVDPVIAGSRPGNLVYFVTVTNLGPSDASGVTLSEVLSFPECVTVDSVVPSRESLIGAAPDYVWDLDELGAGQSEQLTVTLTVAACAADGALIENTAAVLHANEPDPDPENNTAREDTTVRREVTLETTKTGSPDRVIAGSGVGNLTYTVTVRNLGPSDASGVEIGENLTLPPCVTVDQPIPDPSRGVIHGTPPEFTWSVGELPAGEETQWTMTLTVAACAPHGETVVNTATVRVNEPPENSPPPPPVVTPVDTLADLEIISKTDTPDPVMAGEELTYEIHFVNHGPSDAQQVTVTDVLPEHTRFVSSAVPVGWQIAEPPPGEHGEVIFSKGAVSPDETATFQIVVLVTAETPDGTILVNTATADSETDDPDLDNNSKTATTEVEPPPPPETPRQVVQFITPISVYREEGQFQPQPIQPPSKPQWIEGYVWHDLNISGKWEEGEQGREGWWVFLDLNDNGVWDPAEPFAVTDASGRFVFDVDPGSYHLRVDVSNLGLSDGAFAITKFPGSDGHVIELKAGQPVIGASGPTEVPTVPNIAIFVYSPFVRPADQHYEHATHPSSPWGHALLTALEPWQSFTVSNTTGSDFEITEIQKSIEPSRVAVADQFVTIFRKQADGTLTAIAPVELQRQTSLVTLQDPIPVAVGQSFQFFAFYDPAIREGDRVIEQYPDWYGANKHTHPAHTFTRDDHLSVITNTDATFRVDLVGGSTYDSDIFYDGAVDGADVRRLNDELLSIEWPIQDGSSTPFDPLSDVNTRCPNGAEAVMATCAWPLVGVPRREIGLGDFGALNVEWNRARAPFLDLDPDNSSGAKGTGYREEFWGEPVPIADSDARFANRLERELERISFTIIAELEEGNRLDLDTSQLPPTITAATSIDVETQTFLLELSGRETVEVYAEAVKLVKFSSSSLASRTVEVNVHATGYFDVESERGFWEPKGNIAVAQITVESVGDSDEGEITSFVTVHNAEMEASGTSEVSYRAVPAASLESVVDADGGLSAAGSGETNKWQNPTNPDDVNGEGHNTALDALLVINHRLAEHPATGEGEAAGAFAAPPRVEDLLDGADKGTGSAERTQQEVDNRAAFHLVQDSEDANDCPELATPPDTSIFVPATVVDKPSPPLIRDSLFADDDPEDWETAVTDVEELLAEVVQDIMAAGF